MLVVGIFLTFFSASITKFSALLVKRTNPFVSRTQHICGSKADDCTFMIELNATDALHYFRRMQTFVGAMITIGATGEAGIYAFFKIGIIHSLKI